MDIIVYVGYKFVVCDECFRVIVRYGNLIVFVILGDGRIKIVFRVDEWNALLKIIFLKVVVIILVLIFLI